ncbi:MAG: 5'-nucleotidase C-terminal domain-containing protein [Clostridiales bacterium]|nr:5'-nucleotidase C-terminal domain-containing protein [Clostridiales bacterium]
MNPNDKRDLTLILVLLCAVGTLGLAGVWGLAKESRPDSVPVTSSVTDETAAPRSGATIRLFETSDIHGYLMDTTSGEEDEFQFRMAYLAKRISAARADSGFDDVIVLDGGDCYQGETLSNMTDGNVIRAAMDIIGYDAVCIGNHEFDWDIASCCADADATIPPYTMGDNTVDPDIPVLASNLYYSDSHERVEFTRDYTILDKAGYKIAVIGYIPDFSDSVSAALFAPYEIDPSIDRFVARVREINELESPDATIVLCHEDPQYIAEELNVEDVQLVLGGHTHTYPCGVAANGIVFMQPGCYCQGYGYVDLIFDAEGNLTLTDPVYYDFLEHNADLYYYDDQNMSDFDKIILNISIDAWDEAGEALSEEIGYIDVPIEEDYMTGDNNGSTSGNWYTGMMLRATAEYGTVAAFYNTNGIRSDISIEDDETVHYVTVGDIYKVAPFGNTWLVYELTGAELKQQLINGLTRTRYGDQMSGLTFTYERQGTDDDPVFIIHSITLDDGTEVDINDNTTLYRVCTAVYNASLDDGVFYGKTPVYPETEAPVDNVTIIELLRQEAAENDGHIFVDTGARGTLVNE